MSTKMDAARNTLVERTVKLIEDEAKLLATIDRRLGLILYCLNALLDDALTRDIPGDEPAKAPASKNTAPIVPRWAALRRDPERVLIPFRKPDGAA